MKTIYKILKNVLMPGLMVYKVFLAGFLGMEL